MVHMFLVFNSSYFGGRGIWTIFKVFLKFECYNIGFVCFVLATSHVGS